MEMQLIAAGFVGVIVLLVVALKIQDKHTHKTFDELRKKLDDVSNDAYHAKIRSNGLLLRVAKFKVRDIVSDHDGDLQEVRSVSISPDGTIQYATSKFTYYIEEKLLSLHECPKSKKKVK